MSGDEGGNVDVSVSGPFQSKGKGQLPELDMTAEAKGSVGGKNVDFEGGLVLVPNKAYVSYEGDRLRSRPDDLQLHRIGDRRGAAESGAESGTEGATECQEEAAGKFNAGEFVENLTNEGSADVGGTRRPRSAATSTSPARWKRSPS